MKKLLIISAFALLVGCSSAEANDVADDGKCLDDIKHYNHLIKTTGANQATKDAAIVERDKGSEAWATGDKEACETAYQAAWALID